MKKRYLMFIGFMYCSRLFSSEPWLNVPFNEVGKELQKFSASDCSRVFENEYKRLLAVVGVQPVDVIKTIICKMLDDETIDGKRLQKAADNFIAMPIIDAFAEYFQIKNTFNSFLRIRDKSATMFFSLSPKERLAVGLIEKGYPSNIDPNVVVITHYMENELKELPSDVYDEFVKGRKSIVLDQQTLRDCNKFLKSCAMSVIFTFSALYFVVDAPWYVTIGGTALTIGAQFFLLVRQHSSLLTAANNLAKQKTL